MPLDPRRPGLTLWVAWVAAEALGAAIATVLGVLDVPAWANDPAALGGFAHLLTFAVVTSVCGAIVLLFASKGALASLLWVPATVVGTYLWFYVLWFPLTQFPVANYFDYALALGATQCLVLLSMTRRWVSLPLWIGANVVAQPLTDLVTNVSIGHVGIVAVVALNNAAFAAVPGLALIVLFRAGRATGPAPAARSLPAPRL